MNDWMKNMDVVLLYAGDVLLTLGGLIGSLAVLIIGYWIAHKARMVITRIVAPRFGIERGTTSVFLRAIHKALLENGFEIPFPQRDLHIRSVPDVLLPHGEK